MSYLAVMTEDGRVLREEEDLQDGDLWPLAWFDPLHRRSILEQVELPDPPPRWRLLGFPGDARPIAAITNRAWTEWRRARRIPLERERLDPLLRRQVIARDGLVCGLCSGGVDEEDIHIDHVIPVARGGKTIASNLQVSHSACNLAKGARV